MRMFCQLKLPLVALIFLGLGTTVLTLAAKQVGPRAPWIIDHDNKFGMIHSKTAESDLVRMYGRENVTRGTLDIGEGETVPATILFAKIPRERLEIAWKDETTKTLPVRIQIEGNESLWRTKRGVTLGTSLKVLEKLNSGPFALAGFGWDYSGTVTSWNKGRLENDMKNVVLRLGPPVRNEIPSPDEESVEGDADFPSSHPAMQKINPTVYQVIWLFE